MGWKNYKSSALSRSSLASLVRRSFGRMDSLFTVRCFSCGKVVGSQARYQKYRSYIDDEGMQVEEALNELRIFKWCCRARFRCFVPNLGEGYPVDPTIIRTPEDAEALLPPINTSKIGSGPTNYEEDYE